MRFKIGDTVVSKCELVDSACGDHPAFLLCSKGQKLKIKELFSKEEYPIYGKDSYAVQDEKARYGEFYIDEIELE